MNHDVCTYTDPTRDQLRAYARVIAFNADRATLDELDHAREHLQAIAEQNGGPLDTIDAQCDTVMADELLARRGYDDTYAGPAGEQYANLGDALRARAGQPPLHPPVSS